MIRVSTLRNKPVMLDGKRIGLIQQVSLDPMQKRVRALIITCGIRAKRIVMPDDILLLGGKFVSIRQAVKYHRIYDAPFNLFVRDENGMLAGRITDYALKRDSLQIAAAEIRIGYIGHSVFSKRWVFDFSISQTSKDEWIVPACVCM